VLNTVAASAKGELSGLFTRGALFLFFVVTSAISARSPAGTLEASTGEDDSQSHEKHGCGENQKSDEEGFHGWDLTSDASRWTEERGLIGAVVLERSSLFAAESTREGWRFQNPKLLIDLAHNEEHGEIVFVGQGHALVGSEDA